MATPENNSSEGKPSDKGLELGQILPIIKFKDGSLGFKMQPESTGEDLLATARALNGGEVEAKHTINALLGQRFETGHFNNTVVELPDPIGAVNGQAELIRGVQFGDKPTRADLDAAIVAAYGKDKLDEVKRAVFIDL